jgi:hypothetical protein
MQFTDQPGYRPASLDIRGLHEDCETESCVLLRDSRTGMFARLFGVPTAGNFCTHVIESDDELAAALAAVASVKGRHEYDAVWMNTELG